jgi:hypothetical protein
MGRPTLYIGGNRRAVVPAGSLPPRATISKETVEVSESVVPPEARTREAKQLADRYVALWNEADPDRRRRMIAELWTEDAAYLLQPPQEMREIAARPGIGLAARLEARGHAELEARASSVHEEFIARGGFELRRRDDVDWVADVVKFRWEMVSADGGIAGVGLAFLVLATDGTIRRDYQFIES